MNLENNTTVRLNNGSLVAIVRSLYCTLHDVNPIAIPPMIFMGLLDRVDLDISNWDYDNQSLEDWIESDLLILPKPMLSDDELSELMTNDIYYEEPNGNILLVITANVKGIG